MKLDKNKVLRKDIMANKINLFVYLFWFSTIFSECNAQVNKNLMPKYKVNSEYYSLSDINYKFDSCWNSIVINSKRIDYNFTIDKVEILDRLQLLMNIEVVKSASIQSFVFYISEDPSDIDDCKYVIHFFIEDSLENIEHYYSSFCNNEKKLSIHPTKPKKNLLDQAGFLLSQCEGKTIFSTVGLTFMLSSKVCQLNVIDYNKANKVFDAVW